jgi:hypothetical protein
VKQQHSSDVLSGSLVWRFCFLSGLASVRSLRRDLASSARQAQLRERSAVLFSSAGSLRPLRFYTDSSQFAARLGALVEAVGSEFSRRLGVLSSAGLSSEGVFCPARLVGWCSRPACGCYGLVL